MESERDRQERDPGARPRKQVQVQLQRSAPAVEAWRNDDSYEPASEYRVAILSF